MRFERDEVTLLAGIRHGRTLGSPIAIEIANTEWDRWKDEMSPDPGATDAPAHRAAPGARRPRGHAEVRAQRRARRARAGERPGDRRARRRGRRRPGGARRARRVGAQPHRGAGRRPRRASEPAGATRTATASTTTRSAARTRRRPRRWSTAIKAAAKDGDSLGGVAEVLAYGVPVGLGQPRALGPQARRPARPGRDEHPGGEGRRDRRRHVPVRRSAAARRTTRSRATTTRTPPRAGSGAGRPVRAASRAGSRRARSSSCARR